MCATHHRPSMWVYSSKMAPREVILARTITPNGHAHPLVAVLYCEQVLNMAASLPTMAAAFLIWTPLVLCCRLC